MRLEVLIESDNAAFEDAPTQESARILEALANALRDLDPPHEGATGRHDFGPLLDVNGNRVGAWSLAVGTM